MRLMISVLAIFSLILIGCTSNKTMRNDKDPSVKDIAPGQCRIEAQVLKIDYTLSGGSADEPCSKSPCLAWIKIEKIIGYGAGSSTINKGDTLKTKFAFTLSPTNKETFPTLKHALPGLNAGSLFEADIQLMPSYSSIQKKEKLYLVYSYTKLN